MMHPLTHVAQIGIGLHEAIQDICEIYYMEGNSSVTGILWVNFAPFSYIMRVKAG